MTLLLGTLLAVYFAVGIFLVFRRDAEVHISMEIFGREVPVWLSNFTVILMWLPLFLFGKASEGE